MSTYSFTYSSTAESADRVLDDLLKVLHDEEIEKDVARALSVALSEAFTNAIVHGNRLNPAKEVVVELEVDDSEVSADIVDRGKGGLERIDTRTSPTETDEGGRGVDLIRYYADSCSFTEVENGGLKVSITVRRQKKTIGRL